MQTLSLASKNAIHSFYNRLVEAYSLAGNLSGSSAYNNVFRGRQHAISSIAEDMFAILLSELLTPLYPETQLYFMVDYAMRPDRSGSQMWPDIAIIIEREQPMLVSYIDLKTDLGYKRNYHEQFEGICRQVTRLRESNVTGTKTAAGKDLVVSKSIAWRTIVLSEANATSTLVQNTEQATLHAEFFHIYFLAGGKHPNEKNRSAININESVFQLLLADLQKDIADGIMQLDSYKGN